MHLVNHFESPFKFNTHMKPKQGQFYVHTIYIYIYGKPMKINNNLVVLKLSGFTTYINPNYTKSFS
jgi:hypothetical protein